MEKEKNMMVAEDLIKEPPAVSCCQKKNNGLSELDFSQRNSSIAKPECIIRSSPLTEMDNGDEVVERHEKKESQLHETKVPENDSLEEMKSTVHNLRSLLKECFRQLQEERKQSTNLLSQVAELESKVMTYHQVIIQLLGKNSIAAEENKVDIKAIKDTALNPCTETDTKCAKKSTKSFSSAAKVVLSSVKMKHSLERQIETTKLMKQRDAEQTLLSTCGDSFNSKALDMDEELDLEGRPSRFNSLLETSNGDSLTSGPALPEHHKRNKSKKWRKTGMKALSNDPRDYF